MFTHVMVGANNIAASKKFYDAVLGAFGIPEGKADPKGRIFISPKLARSASPSQSMATLRRTPTAALSASRATALRKQGPSTMLVSPNRECGWWLSGE